MKFNKHLQKDFSEEQLLNDESGIQCEMEGVHLGIRVTRHRVKLVALADNYDLEENRILVNIKLVIKSNDCINYSVKQYVGVCTG
jgi:hypothetical protein